MDDSLQALTIVSATHSAVKVTTRSDIEELTDSSPRVVLSDQRLLSV